MKHIHPFPARMAPEIALEKISALQPGQTVLDPMAGSGMVLQQAVRSGICAIGFDLDPLAELISRVGASAVDADEAIAGLQAVLQRCTDKRFKVSLPWIDSDTETTQFVDFWYAPKQKEQLRKLAMHLVAKPIDVSNETLDVIKVALSRLIVTKEPKASLARDTAHSRPHKTIRENDFDIFEAMTSSLRHVLSVLGASSLMGRVTTFIGDARDLREIESNSIDCIVTSPPYLNAIDYMRGHRMSLVWLGYRLSELREIRSTSIGAERSLNDKHDDKFLALLSELGLKSLDARTINMLHRYFTDLVKQTKEAHRVLKKGALGTYVIGNSTIRGTYIKNSEFLKRAGALAGFSIQTETEREIPDHRRYMPIPAVAGNSLASRMRAEHIIDFKK
ncbi:hypothetical protein WHX56_22280 [Achromobacter veterisilvae]|uniref:site-specific DNA-methyltransferase (cytosine-N(4)-specific) n=1 Tax=Achromobacter veterisilvae TaxID=2069367 RepID=A0ABZ2RUL3_9BURK